MGETDPKPFQLEYGKAEGVQPRTVFAKIGAVCIGIAAIITAVLGLFMLIVAALSGAEEGIPMACIGIVLLGLIIPLLAATSRLSSVRRYSDRSY